MAEKNEILEYITKLAEQKVVTKDELNAAYDAGCEIKTVLVPPATAVTEPAASSISGKRVGIAEILYYIGAAIVFLGIVILVAQNWKTLGFGPRVLATMGGGLAAYSVGLIFSRDERLETAAPAFFLISALIMPVGLYVIFDNAGIRVSSYGYQSLISGILFATYLASFFVFRKSIFVLFSILYGTWLFFSLTSYLLVKGPQFDEQDFYMYRALFAGISYMLLGHAFSKTRYSAISGLLNNFGLLGFLGAALALGGEKPRQNVFWELIYPGLVFGILFLSVHLKSKAYLVWGTIFLMLYLLKITSEYFTKGFGWPLALVMLGLSLIGVGYMSVSIKRKYLSV